MAVRNDFTAGEVLAAADLNDTFASKLPYSYGTATPSTTESGFLWYDSNSTPAATKFWNGSAFVPFGGKILQVVRATDSTNRSTTSTSLVDVTGMSITITPQKSDSAVLIIAYFTGELSSSTTDRAFGYYAITDNSDNLLVGEQLAGRDFIARTSGESGAITDTNTMIAYATPATTSAVTYKLRFRAATNTTNLIRNATGTGQMYALEVSA